MSPTRRLTRDELVEFWTGRPDGKPSRLKVVVVKRKKVIKGKVVTVCSFRTKSKSKRPPQEKP